MIVKGFVSDMDGVLAKTEEHWYKGTLDFLKTYGANLSREEYSKLIGTPEEDDAKFFKETFKIPETEKDIVIRRRSSVLKVMDRGIILNDGYLELLDLLEKNKIKISLVSTSPKVIIDKVMEKTGIRRYFTSMVSVEDAGTKVDAYVLATNSMGVGPSECFSIEDSVHGGYAAKKAGLYCVIIPNSFITGNDFSFADEVHKTIKDFLQNGDIWNHMEMMK